MPTESKYLETITQFVPPPYGTFFKVVLGLFDFAHSFGRGDPLAKAIAVLQQQIEALAAAIVQVNARLNDHARRLAKIENERHVDKLRELGREAKRIAFRIGQHPPDTRERALLANDAIALADRFLEEPDIWEWTDLSVTNLYDDFGKFVREGEVRPLVPDFKAQLALPGYANAIMLLIAAIDLDTGGAPSEVRAQHDDALRRHVAACSSRYNWDEYNEPAQSLAEKIRARITCRPSAINPYAAKGECRFGILCENVMERKTTVVADATIWMADTGGSVLCMAPPGIGRAEEEAIEEEKGVGLLRELAYLMGRVLRHGSLRDEFIGHFSMAPVQPLAILYGIREEGGVDWYRQTAPAAPGGAAGWTGPIYTYRPFGLYTRMFPAGGNGFYGLREDGVLQWMRHDDFNDGGFRWTGPVDVGTGWNGFVSITPGGDGVLYALRPDGTLLWYRHHGAADGGGVETWSGSHAVHSGFGQYRRIFSVNDGVLYAMAPDGNLYWYRHKGFKDGAAAWEGPHLVGWGWQDFRDIFGTDNGIVYAQKPDGTLLRYVHNGWKTGGDVTTWDGPHPISFGVGGYKQVLTLMSRAPDPVK